MVFVTITEYEETKLCALDDRVYKLVERAFVQAVGYVIAERLLTRFAEKTLREISQNSYADVLSAVRVLR